MKETVLIVDDEQPLRNMLGGMLEGMGYTVLLAASGAEALERVGDVVVDVVITDLKMPGMDGLSLAQKLLEQDPDRPVLAMTAYADLDSARRAVKIGVYEYFAKPFDVNDVLAGVRRALERRRLALENRAYQSELEQKVAERTHELEQKVRELEARDALLQHMLSIQAPEDTLALAVKLALGLCGCEAGALYVPDKDGRPRPRAAVGFLGHGAGVAGKDLQDLNLDGDANIGRALRLALEEGDAVYLDDPGPDRRGFGIHSVGVLPVRRGETGVALLEVCRKGREAPVGGDDLKVLMGFLPYVAMALADCAVQEEMSDWEEGVETMLRATEQWEKQDGDTP